MTKTVIFLLIAVVLLAVSLGFGRKLLLENPYLLTRKGKLGRFAAGLGAGLALFMAVGAFTFSDAEGDKGWITDIREGFRLSRELNRPVLVDAWAVWCTSCIELKKKTFSDPKVAEALAEVVKVQVDMDAPENQWVWDEYDIKGLPWVAWFKPGQTKKPEWFFSEFEPPERFLTRLQGGSVVEEGVDSWLASRGVFWTLLLVFLAGIGASLTPCAYPSYGLIIAFFAGGRGNARRSTAVSAAIAGLIVLGMVTSYSAAGVLAALGGGAMGKLMANPYVMSAIALLFMVMGASSLGVLPQMEFTGLKTALQAGQKATPVWAFVFGLVMGLIVAPCVGPILVGILTYIATAGDISLGVLLMVTFGLGMGVLFFAMALFSQTLKSRLRPGRWGEVITVAFSIVFFAAAFYYLKGVLPLEELFTL